MRKIKENNHALIELQHCTHPLHDAAPRIMAGITLPMDLSGVGRVLSIVPFELHQFVVHAE